MNRSGNNYDPLKSFLIMYHYWGKKYIVTLHKTTQGMQRFPLFTEQCKGRNSRFIIVSTQCLA